jgi:hypothetical protein
MSQESDPPAASEGWTPRGAPAVEAEVPSMWVLPFLRGALWGAFVFVLLVGLASIDFAATHDEPVEQARITRQYLTGERIWCGRGANNRDEIATDFVIDHPRSGLPTKFTIRGCGTDEVPGDVVPIARTGPNPDDVYLHPIEGVGQLIALGSVGGAATSALVFFGCAVYARAARWFSRRRDHGAKGRHAS